MNLPLTPVRFLRYSEQQFPRKTAVVCQENRFTYAEFADRVGRLAGALRSVGVKPSDRVAFLSLNCHRLLEAYYGVLEAGGILLPLNIRLAAPELVYILNHSGAAVLFLEQEFVALVDSFRRDLQTVRSFYQLDGTPQADWLSDQTYEQALVSATPFREELMAFDENSVAEIFYTSGTSASPKGVMLTHRNVYLHAMNLAVYHHTRYEDVLMHTIPLFHANGWGAAHTITSVGGTHVMLPRFVPEEVFRLVERERVSALSLVPVMATALVNCPTRSKYNLSSVQWSVIGGAASSPTLIREVETILGFKCFSGYGLTECSPSLATAELKPGVECTPEERHVVQAMTGYAYPGHELRVVDAQDKDVPHDGATMGEIIARSDGVMAGYWQQPEATAEAMRGGWFHTGDMAVVAENGYIRIVDRKKDIIVSGGENISSLEVEKALVAHPDVYEAAVIPVVDEKWGEVPLAVVVAKPGRKLTETELIEFCRAQLAHYKCPQAIEFCQSLPRTATGKVLKRELRKKYGTDYSPLQRGDNNLSRRSFAKAPMNNLVRVTKDNDVAVITIDNPPINALSPGVPQAIEAAIDEMNADPAIKAAVIIGAGRTFIAGADIKEFGKMTSGATPRRTLLPFLLHIEDSIKPVVIAIHGTAFGGGLELAMAGHYRVASPTAQVGQPEVKLGIIPGAAGTQRLPRLVGVAKAVEMCAEGKPVSAPDAAALGLIDSLIDGDLLSGAVAFARGIADKPIPKTRERTTKLGTATDNAAVFAAARDAVRKKQRGMKAPLAAIDAVEAATRLSFEEGCQAEQKLFTECLFSDQSKALIHVFFGEREVGKIPDIPKETPVIAVNRAAVVGSGTMGGGIAMVFANAGIPVLLKDVDQAALDAGMGKIRKNYASSVQRGRFTQQFVDERLQLITPVLSYDGFADADMVVEAVFEGMALKKSVFAELDRSCKPGAILASNTSTLNIDEIAASTSRPEAVIGTHFFSPANVMRLLEIVRGKKSGKEVIATCMQLSKKLGKVGVLVGNCRGFVGNRMFGPYRREAQFLVEEGAGIEAVDKALVDFGNAMGPLATGDLAGLDVGWRIRKEYRHLEKPGIPQPFAEDRLCELGRYGQKTTKGWYRYDENRRANADPEVAALVRKWSAEAGIPQRQISADEIVDRCIYALVNEGARILEEGFALRAVDIDIIYLNGYGFPAYRGGPMWHADTVGLQKVYQRICEFHQQHGELWAPAPLLQRLAESGKTFAEFDKEHALAA